MASDTQRDDTAVGSIRRAVGPLLSGLTRAVFGVSAVAFGVIALVLATSRTTPEGGYLLLVLGIGALLAGTVTIRRLPKPSANSTDEPAADRFRTDERDR